MVPGFRFVFLPSILSPPSFQLPPGKPLFLMSVLGFLSGMNGPGLATRGMAASHLGRHSHRNTELVWRGGVKICSIPKAALGSWGPSKPPTPQAHNSFWLHTMYRRQLFGQSFFPDHHGPKQNGVTHINCHVCKPPEKPDSLTRPKAASPAETSKPLKPEEAQQDQLSFPHPVSPEHQCVCLWLSTDKSM